MVPCNIHLSRPNIPSYEKLEPMFKDIFESMIITETRGGSKYSKLFKEKIAKYLNVGNAMLLPNCTTGLLILLHSLKTELLPGRPTIITPSYTYSATANAIEWCGCNPVFVDINDTCTMDPGLVPDVGATAILPVNLYGNPCDIKAFEKISKQTGIPLIFDSAHAFGAEYNEKKIGGFGNAETFSLAAAKLVTSGEGGLITTNDNILADSLEAYKWAGNKRQEYNSVCFGLSGRLPELSSILGIGSLDRLEEEIAVRKKIAKIYKTELHGISDISFMKEQDKSRQTYYIFPIFTRHNRKLFEELSSKGIECRPDYFCPPIHKMIAYHEFHSWHLPVTEQKANTVLALPIHSKMSEEGAVFICKTIKDFLKEKQLL